MSITLIRAAAKKRIFRNIKRINRRGTAYRARNLPGFIPILPSVRDYRFNKDIAADIEFFLIDAQYVIFETFAWSGFRADPTGK